ncbi:hypothetical protein BOTBODRAFT_48825 [Botryobasidium botryosum FD-172 SS1]|uniref:Uncharacterized protein n=1 Tax=Botryobasidium botryosum (strain FD-172 SS1) TaxID=930990 RepID=A0A067LVM9_BOTB1|nr:hypothetical protein BOTBODRAFT_48825 [Botryobasidium botryosum FD-172 SS1]
MDNFNELDELDDLPDPNELIASLVAKPFVDDASDPPSFDPLDFSVDLPAVSTQQAACPASPPVNIRPPFSVDTFVELIQPEAVKKARARSKSSTVQRRGPIPMCETMDWEELVEKITQLFSTTPGGLPLSTMEWRFQKPANATCLPLNSASAYRSLVNQLETARRGSVVLIKIHLPAGGLSAPLVYPTAAPPMYTLPAPPSLGYTTPFPTPATPVPSAVTTPAITVPNPPMDDVNDVIAFLEHKYSVGRCREHSNIRCFHDRATNLHHELTKLKLLVWAKAIIDTSATPDFLPNSNHFRESEAISRRKTRSPSKVPDLLDRRRASPPSYGRRSRSPDGFRGSRHWDYGFKRHPYRYRYPDPLGFQGTPPMYPPQPLMWPGYPQTQPQLPIMPYAHTYPSAYAPPPPPAPPVALTLSSVEPIQPESSPADLYGEHSLEEFCVMTRLDEHVKGLLSKLGFQPGDDLSVLRPSDWGEVGFKTLEWERACRASLAYRQWQISKRKAGN